MRCTSLSTIPHVSYRSQLKFLGTIFLFEFVNAPRHKIVSIALDIVTPPGGEGSVTGNVIFYTQRDLISVRY